MYDTITLKITANEVKGVDFLEVIPCCLNNVAFHNFNGVDVVTGTLNGLKVIVNSNQVKIKEGSFCKWHLGDNYKQLGRGEVERAIEKLSDQLHLPMSKATVTRMDIAVNVLTKHPTALYFNHLGALRYAQRLEEPDGLYYKQANGRLCFYDKNQEQREKGEVIPELYNGKNVLRYEQRYLHRLPKQLGVEVVTGAMLYDEDFYIKLLKQFSATYKAIEKINDITLNFGAMAGGKKEFYKMCVLYAIEQQGGQVEMLNQIKEAQTSGQILSKTAYDLRQVVNDACKTGEGLTVKSEAIDELNKKISEAMRYYR